MPRNETQTAELVTATVDAATQGTTVCLKVDASIEAFFSSWGNADVVKGRLPGYVEHSAYRMTPQVQAMVNECMAHTELGGNMADWNEGIAGLFDTAGRINLTFLRTKGLKDGVTFNLVAVHLPGAVEKWGDGLRAFVAELHRRLVTPSAYRLSVRAEWVR